jgi:peptidoglycan/xylan/chitin deacetylase (PgdA/CDA1 family)
MFIAPFLYLLAQLFIVSNPNTAIVPVSKPVVVDSLAKYVYLSFDDGPLPGTSNCIDVCEQLNVEATFFEIALHQSRSSYAKKLYNRIRQNETLFVLCNHSYSHSYGKYVQFYHRPDTALADFLLAKKILAPSNNLVRLPGNNAWNTQVSKRSSGLVKPLVKKLDSAGFNVMGWDLEWHFDKHGKPVQSPEHVANMVDTLFKYNETMVKNHIVILMHDQMFRTSVDSAKLQQMIGQLKKNPHYQFRKLTEFPGLKNGGH